jgi:hypothetical protein
MQSQRDLEIPKDDSEQTTQDVEQTREKQIPRREQAATDIQREKVPARNSRAEIQNPLMHESY